jgi:hypothetical protein
VELVDALVSRDLSPCPAREALDVSIRIAMWAIEALRKKVANRGLAGAHHAEKDNVSSRHVDTVRQRGKIRV